MPHEDKITIKFSRLRGILASIFLVLSLIFVTQFIPWSDPNAAFFGVLFFFCPACYFGYFSIRALSTGEQIVMTQELITGKMLKNREITWPEIESIEFKTNGSYARLTLICFSGNRIDLRDIGFLTPTLQKAYKLIENRLDTGELAWPKKSPFLGSPEFFIFLITLMLVCLFVFLRISGWI